MSYCESMFIRGGNRHVRERRAALGEEQANDDNVFLAVGKASSSIVNKCKGGSVPCMSQ